MLNLAEEFLARGIAVDLLVAAEAPGRALPAGLGVVPVGRRARHALPRTVAYLRRARPDAVISARSYINLMMLAAHRMSGLGPGCRLVWTFHTHRSMQISRSRGIDRIAEVIALRCLDLADARVAVSAGVAADLARAAGPRAPAVTVIENPAWSAARAAALRAPCPHPWLSARPPGGRGGAPVLLAAGRLAPQKDLPTLLRAFAMARASRPDLRLLILGEGAERGRLAALAAELGLDGALDMPGQVDNPLAYMARADLFVLSSLWEGFAMVLVEALGAGAPVVSTDCPAGPAEVLEDGRLGRLVPSADPGALAAAMLETLAAPPDPAPGRAAAERFSAARAADRYLALIAGR